MNDAFQYIKDNRGINIGTVYPYVSGQLKAGTCRYKKNSNDSTCAGYVDVVPATEAALLTALATVGPISVAIYASSSKFASYSSGVYYDKACIRKDPDHAGRLSQSILNLNFFTNE